MFDHLKGLFARRRRLPYGDCFISRAFDDEQPLKDLLACLPPGVNPVVFERIPETPEMMISNVLIGEIRRCDSLVYVRGGKAVNSRWVMLERDYALRAGKDVYCFDAGTLVMRRDRARPARLAVFPSYSRQDGAKVQELIAFMRRERSFDLFHDIEDRHAGADWAETINRELEERLDAGGYLVLFWSSKTVESAFSRKEAAFVASRYPGQILIALLEPAQLPPMLDAVRAVKLYADGRRGISKLAADYLIVELYWLIYQQHARAGAR